MVWGDEYVNNLDKRLLVSRDLFVIGEGIVDL